MTELLLYECTSNITLKFDQLLVTHIKSRAKPSVEFWGIKGLEVSFFKCINPVGLSIVFDQKVSQRNHVSTPLSGIPQKPEFSVHVDEDVVNHPPTLQQDMHFDKVLSARKPSKSFVTEALRNKVS